MAILPPGPRDAVEAASVLGQRVEPRRLADLAGTTELAAVRHCEELVQARLLVRSGAHYEFANDLVQECVLASLVPALAVAYHRRAADLTTDRPETMAEHAFAAGDRERAAQGWLLAGEAAMGRSAVEDAADLFGRGLDTTTDPVLRARLLLARAVAGEARTAYGPALADIEEALSLARATGNRRLEMDALRARGGDVPIGLHLPTTDVLGHLESALLIATELGARRAEADIGARLTILDVSRLRLTSALARAERMLARLGNLHEDVRVPALDGLKAALAYLGDVDRLGEVVDELEPLLRRRGSTWLLQWTVFEAAFVPASAGAWDDARARVDEALRINRRSGYPAYSGFFEAHQGWFDRLAGDLDGALRARPPCRRAHLRRRPPLVVRRRLRAARRDAGGRGSPGRGGGHGAAGAGRDGTRDGRGVAAALRRTAGGRHRRRRGLATRQPAAPRCRVPTRAGLGGGRRLLPAGGPGRTATGHARRGRRAARRAAAGDGDPLELRAGPARRARPQMRSASSPAARCAPPGGTGR